VAERPAHRPGAKQGAEAGSVLTRALRILSLAASSERALTLPEMGAALDVPKPTLHRLVARLEKEGFLEREPGGRHVRAGPALVRMGFALLRNDGTRGERHAILEALVDQIGETCNFTVPSGLSVLYLDRVESRWPLRLHLEPGSRVPLHCTSSGKLFLAAMDEARRARVLETLALPAHTPRTITSRERLDQELARIQACGHSIDDEEFLLGLVAIATPVRDARGRTVAAVACHAPSARLSVDQALAHLPALAEAAVKLGRTLPEL
jgi:DNA-binding IclR family transcriptional regulator